MTEVLFILPRDDGIETPFGEELRHSCSKNDPISSLFDVIRKRLGEGDVRLSLEGTEGNTAVLGQIDPQSQGHRRFDWPLRSSSHCWLQAHRLTRR